MKKKTIAIVGSGPADLLADLKDFENDVDIWIGADRGAYWIAKAGLPLAYALGDFDSADDVENDFIRQHAEQIDVYPAEKDETDMEIAISKAISLDPARLFLFGVTGGRLDHEIINIQQLFLLRERGISGVIADSSNMLELAYPGIHELEEEEAYPYISFVPFSEKVIGITLEGFLYPLEKKDIAWGSTLCISNRLLSKTGTFSFEKGILLVVKSRDAIQK